MAGKSLRVGKFKGHGIAGTNVGCELLRAGIIDADTTDGLELPLEGVDGHGDRCRRRGGFLRGDIIPGEGGGGYVGSGKHGRDGGVGGKGGGIHGACAEMWVTKGGGEIGGGGGNGGVMGWGGGGECDGN